MKQQLYWTILSISLGIIGVVLLRPSLLDQCCAFLKIAGKTEEVDSRFHDLSELDLLDDPFAKTQPVDRLEIPFSVESSDCEQDFCRIESIQQNTSSYPFNSIDHLLEPESSVESEQFFVGNPIQEPIHPSVPAVPQPIVSQDNSIVYDNRIVHDSGLGQDNRDYSFGNMPDPLTETEMVAATTRSPDFAAIAVGTPSTDVALTHSGVVQAGFIDTPLESKTGQTSVPHSGPLDTVSWNTPIFNDPYTTLPSQDSVGPLSSEQSQSDVDLYSVPNPAYSNSQPQSVPNPTSFDSFGVQQRPNPFSPAPHLQVQTPVVEILPCPGAETIARVGTEVLLGCDVLPEIKKIAYYTVQDQLEKMSPEDRAKITDEMIAQQRAALVAQIFPSFLEQQIKLTLLYCDFAMGRKKEEIQLQERRFGDLFDEKIVPDLQKRFGVKTKIELNEKLEREIGSSLDREKASFTRRVLAENWLNHTVREAGDGECTYDEMSSYYETHLAEFERKARARWSQITVRFSNEMPVQEAWKKISWIGNQIVLEGVPFEQIAPMYSDDLRAKDGGIWPWTGRGVLASQELEQAVFSQPIGLMGPIVQDRWGVHIIRVLEREEQHYVPFMEVQASIRDKIKEQRRLKKETEYISELYRRYHPEIYQNSVAELRHQEVKVVIPEERGTSLHTR
ncbi:MAG: peptidylprolyl isomerase [Thermoguttaceae bacterium]